MKVAPLNDKGKTVRCLFCLFEPYFTSDCCMVLDSGFCVLEGILELRKNFQFTYKEVSKLDNNGSRKRNWFWFQQLTNHWIICTMQSLECFMKRNIYLAGERSRLYIEDNGKWECPDFGWKVQKLQLCGPMRWHNNEKNFNKLSHLIDISIIATLWLSQQYTQFITNHEL